MINDLNDIVNRVVKETRPSLGQGRVANYIPALGAIDPRKFGIAIFPLNEPPVVYGNADEPFSIQSISKVFTLTLALEAYGADLWAYVGREPSGTPFNSIVQLEQEAGLPRNPFINAGAIAVTATLLKQQTVSVFLDHLVTFVQQIADDETISIDQVVARSEAETGNRNRSLAAFMASFNNLAAPVEDALNAYFNQCALAMSCRQLARAGLFLANKGLDPISGRRLISPERCRRMNALMLTCGHYDGSGEFAFRVGLPGKSGVGGGILAIAPGHASIAVWSPGLNERGNSLAGTVALERLAKRTGWSVFSQG